MLALIRYLTLRSRGGKAAGLHHISLRHSYCAIAAVIFFVSVANTPNFLTYQIMDLPLSDTCTVTDPSVNANASAYVPGVSRLAVEADCLVFRMAFWISGTVFKMVPCLLLTLLVSLLTRILNEVRESRRRLFPGGAGGSSSKSSAEPTTTGGASNYWVSESCSYRSFSSLQSLIVEKFSLKTIDIVYRSFIRIHAFYLLRSASTTHWWRRHQPDASLALCGDDAVECRQQ